MEGVWREIDMFPDGETVLLFQDTFLSGGVAGIPGNY
jgi:hypothetical protein